MQLHEKYRPQRLEDVLGQEKIVSRLALLRDRDGLAGRTYWLSGASGTGKTTIARLIAAEVAGEWTTVEIDSHTLTPNEIDRIELLSADAT